MGSEIGEVERRKRVADYYYDNYTEYFRRDDLAKASEFLWGAINNLTNCVGLLDGQRLSDHGEVVEYLESLADVRQDQGMADGAAAQTIHANFYHNFMSKDVFEYNGAKA